MELGSSTKAQTCLLYTSAFVLLGSFMISGCSKDEILNHYNNIVQSAGSIELTGKSSLQGEKEKGIDDYTGTYTCLLYTSRCV